MARISPVVVSLVAWTAGAVTAVSVGLIALSAIGVGLTDDPIRSLATNPPYEPLPRVSAATPSTSVSSPATSRPDVTPTGAPTSQRTVASRGGTVVASCRTSGAYLVGWSPAPGYRTDDVQRGPGPVAKLAFKGPVVKVEIVVRCVNGVVQSSVEEEGPGDD